jgi:predicted Zn-dependent protease with MMP-like domain
LDGNDRAPARRARRHVPQDRRIFERLVAEAMDGLPERFRRRLANVDVVVEDEPSREQLVSAGLPPGETLLGLYQGTPLTERTSYYGMVLPDKISIFRGPIERYCRSRREIREQVRQTIVHEFAHHFGLSDEELDELGA